MSQPTIVFDLDGTLIDTAPDLLDSLDHALLSAGMPGVDPVAHRSHVGFGGRVMIERAFLAQRRELAPEQLQDLLDIFLDHYSAQMPGKSAPFPGALDVITAFRGAGYLIAICTNKTERLAKRLMQALALENQFAAICGADTFGFRKPDPRHLTETIRLAGGTPANSIMVGDSRTDIDTAKAAGIPVVAVDFGYTDRHVREFEPSVVISHFDELTLALAERLIASARG
ncbi:MAG: HAD family hydrolase [Pseudomonadota bacterium]